MPRVGLGVCRPMNSRETASGAVSVVECNREKKEISLHAEKAPSEPFGFDQVRPSANSHIHSLPRFP